MGSIGSVGSSAEWKAELSGEVLGSRSTFVHFFAGVSVTLRGALLVDDEDEAAVLVVLEGGMAGTGIYTSHYRQY